MLNSCHLQTTNSLISSSQRIVHALRVAWVEVEGRLYKKSIFKDFKNTTTEAPSYYIKDLDFD